MKVIFEKSSMEHLVDYAKSWLGVPYIWGGEGRDGADCSGFVQEILRAAGRDPRGDQTADALFRYFVRNHEGDRLSRPKAGAVVFYGSDDKKTHCAFALNEDLIIEAAGGGRQTLTVDDAHRDKAFVRIRPYNYRLGEEYIVMPRYLFSV